MLWVAGEHVEHGGRVGLRGDEVIVAHLSPVLLPEQHGRLYRALRQQPHDSCRPLLTCRLPRTGCHIVPHPHGGNAGSITTVINVFLILNIIIIIIIIIIIHDGVGTVIAISALPSSS